MMQYSVQLDLSVNLAGTNIKCHNCYSGYFFSTVDQRWPRLLRAYLLPLVRFGDACMWDNLGCVNFIGGEVGHLVAFCKTSLENKIKKILFRGGRALFVGINPAVAAETLFALPFPKLSHGSSTSQWPDRWLFWPSPGAHCARRFSFCEVRRISVSDHTCCCCLCPDGRCISVLPSEAAPKLPLRMLPGKSVSELL